MLKRDRQEDGPSSNPQRALGCSSRASAHLLCLVHKPFPYLFSSNEEGAELGEVNDLFKGTPSPRSCSFLLYRMGRGEGSDKVCCAPSTHAWYKQVNTNHVFTVPFPTWREFLWKFLWSTHPEPCWRHDHFLMRSYILSLYYPSGTVVEIGPGDTQCSTKHRNLCGPGADRFIGGDKVNV